MDTPIWDVLKDRDPQLGPDAGALVQEFRHWRVARDGDDVLWAVLDRADASVNALSADVLAELGQLLDKVADRAPKALVLRSAKPTGFSPGADINQFVGLTDRAAVAKLVGQAHDIVNRLDALTIPTIAVLHGSTLGGGLELALACTYRIGVEGVRLGLPEVLLGLHPGMGGTARLTALIDPIEAMTAMLTGKTIHDRKAKRLGLIDALVPERHVAAAVAAAVAGTLHQGERSLTAQAKQLGPARHFAARQMRAQTQGRVQPEHYPAPYALIDLWEMHGGDKADMLRAEIDSFAGLMVGETAQNLIRVYFLREKLRRFAGKGGKAKHIHVIGAGAMGGEIAAWAAWQGLTATLGDIKAEPIARAIGHAAALFEKIGHGDGIRVRDALDRLIPDLTGEGLRHADIVIEAAPEKVDLKRRIHADAEKRMRKDAILATNTSSIPLETLRDGLKRPERLVGIHFFNPVSRMDLVEVIRHDALDADVEARARAFVGQISKLPIPAKSAPGFVVNRALTPYLVEAMAMLAEGHAAETIDQAALDFGMPMGPLELADQVGLDVGMEVAESLKRDLNWPMPDTPQWLRDKVAAGQLGKKTGGGIYPWKDGHAVKRGDAPAPSSYMTDRLILPLVNTCVALLREGVAEDADAIDAAMIFGTGFAPFRGGPLHYARARGVDRVCAMLEQLAAKYGPRFTPDAGWDALRS